MAFKLETKFKPDGDQPKAIQSLVSGLKKGMKHQTLLGVTGSGKTFTVANVIKEVDRPTLVIAHNKTLAAQLCNEFRELFLHASVNYFVSYYDYYQPEAYMPSSDTYIEKEAMINDEIDKLRHAATMALLTRRDVIVVASVSCIYGLGAPEEYKENIFRFKAGDVIERPALMRKLVELQFTRTNADLKRGTFRVRGDNWEIMPPDREVIYTFRLLNKKIDEIYEVNPVHGFQPGITPTVPEITFAPAKHFITSGPKREQAIKNIRAELAAQIKVLEKEGKLLEVERLERRTRFDLAMIEEVGYCHGIENYSRHLSGRPAGEAPSTLLDYFPKDFLLVVDESHVTLPQIRGMYAGDAARKKTLIEYGFRLPSAADNRPLKFDEFEERIGQTIYVSATPEEFEVKKSDQVIEQIIRPTGLVDPEIIIRPAKGQVEDLKGWIRERVKNKERVLVTTLTKKMAEDLSEYLTNTEKIRAVYLHSDVKTFDRIKILSDFRRGKHEVLVGVNLLREGLDLPEVSLVAILDADKEGFLRSETSLIQTIGRAARNVKGQVVLYADTMTGSLTRAVGETNRRRAMQLAYNKKHGITPKTIERRIKDISEELGGGSGEKVAKKIMKLELGAQKGMSVAQLIKEKEKEMREAANDLDFELAAILRDELKVLKKEQLSQQKQKP